MKPRPKWLSLLAPALLIAGSLALLLPGFAQEQLEVAIGGASPSVGRHSHAHDITLEALRAGKTEYLLKGGSEGSHKITLNKQQVSDLLNGTTIIVQSEKNDETGKMKAHQHRVTLTVKTEERERSGW